MIPIYKWWEVPYMWIGAKASCCLSVTTTTGGKKLVISSEISIMVFRYVT